ncbi:MAG TPA: methyltransferase domain-containing protein [Vicinamibacterales bacterium]|nr:methyltransferase domain-containing protein [Vicinamibacterales bacterium]
MADPPARSRWREHALILGHFLRHPGTVGTVAPSSAWLAREMVGALEPGRPQIVVELGPGTGAFTEAIIDRLRPGDRLLAVELEPAFVSQLRGRFPSLDCACASATQLVELARARNFSAVDHIVSGLPFATLPVDASRQVLDAIQRVLRPGGTFTTFQYLHAYLLPRAAAFRREVDERLGGKATRSTVFRNFPPAFVLRWRAKG